MTRNLEKLEIQEKVNYLIIQTWKRDDLFYISSSTPHPIHRLSKIEDETYVQYKTCSISSYEWLLCIKLSFWEWLELGEALEMRFYV